MPASKRAASSTRRTSRAATPAAANGPGEVLKAPAINLQRIVQSVDPLGQAGAALESTLTPLRAAAVTKIFTGFDLVHRSLFNIGAILQQPPLPAVLLGLVEQPGGGPAVGVQVELNPATLGATGDPVWALTNGAGHFQLTPPPGLLIPAGGLQLTVQGATVRVAVTVPANQVASNGAVGVIVLPQVVAPMPQSIIASLANIAGGLSGGGQPAPPAPTAALPTVTLGEDNGCQLTYNGQAAIDRFPYGVFFRLVAPQLSIVQTFHWARLGNAQIPLPLYEGQAGVFSGVSSYADRVPVEQPLERRRLPGPDHGPGRRRHIRQRRDGADGRDARSWICAEDGAALDLPGLGPGRSGLLAAARAGRAATGGGVRAHRHRFGVRERNAFGKPGAAADRARRHLDQRHVQFGFQRGCKRREQLFDALRHVELGRELPGCGRRRRELRFQWRFEFVDAGPEGRRRERRADDAFGGGKPGQRPTQRRPDRHASGQLQRERTVTTKTITNHNHLHALTMQYWEVQRLYDVRTEVEDLDFVCLVPMQIVRFMPPGQPLTVGDPNALTASRQAVLDRYAAIIKHIDVLATALPRAFQKGLETLRQFAGDPSAQVEPFGGAAEDVIQFNLMGTFIPGEEVWINAVTAMGTRVGPAKLAPPAGFALPENQFQTQDDLLARLRLQRVAPTPFSGALALPPYARQDPDRRFRDHAVFPPDRLHAGFAVSAKSAADQRPARGIGGQLAGRVPRPPKVPR